jgi:hypothetical protein
MLESNLFRTNKQIYHEAFERLLKTHTIAFDNHEPSLYLFDTLTQATHLEIRVTKLPQLDEIVAFLVAHLGIYVLDICVQFCKARNEHKYRSTWFPEMWRNMMEEEEVVPRREHAGKFEAQLVRLGGFKDSLEPLRSVKLGFFGIAC